MEWLLIENFNPDNRKVDINDDTRQELKRLLMDYVKKEKDQRAMIEAEQFRQAGEAIVYPLVSRETIDYDEHACFYCVDLCYTSWVECKTCDKEYCLKHGFVCPCDKTTSDLRLVYRYTNEELEAFCSHK